MKLVFCLPGKIWPHTFLSGWNQTLLECATRKIELSIAIAYSASVAEARNSVLRGNVGFGVNQLPFSNGELDYDYMIWLDSDVVFKPDQIFRLLSHQKDIVSGYYKMQSGKFPMIESYPDNFTGSWPFMTEDEMIHRKSKKSGLFKVMFNGFGFFCIKKGVFESMEFPWFRHDWVELAGIKFQASEDISWCRTAIANGYDIWVDPELRVGHYKEYTI